ncbi:MAG: hypothetical protein WC900_08340 [Oscillospiraceae bacterium]|jgi:hypothetical protein
MADIDFDKPLNLPHNKHIKTAGMFFFKKQTAARLMKRGDSFETPFRRDINV